MAIERPPTIICEWCGRPAPNPVRRGPNRRFHLQCKDEKRKAAQQAKRADPVHREERNRRERERRARRSKDPKERELANAKQRNYRRKIIDQAKLFEGLEPRLAQMDLRIKQLELELDKSLPSIRSRLRAVEQQLPGGKGIGL